jgi:hypothetical protein
VGQRVNREERASVMNVAFPGWCAVVLTLAVVAIAVVTVLAYVGG